MIRSKKNWSDCCKGIIFDIDGTIVNSMRYHIESWKAVLHDHGYEMTYKEVGEKLAGINDEIAERFLGGRIPKEERTKIWKEKEERFREKFHPEENVIEGFFPFLEAMQKRGIALAIGSSAPEENVTYILSRLNILDRFKAIIQGEDVNVGKPDPEVFIKAASLLDIPIQDCLVFEDSYSGAEASFRAGSRTIIILTSKTKSNFSDIRDIEMFIQDYSELPDQEIGDNLKPNEL